MADSVIQAATRIFESDRLIVKARLTNDQGVRLSSDGASSTIDVTGVTVNIYDLSEDPTTAAVSETPAVSDCLASGAEGYQTQNWTKGGSGWNFLYVKAGPWKGGHKYRAEISVAYTSTFPIGTFVESPVNFEVLFDVVPGFSA